MNKNNIILVTGGSNGMVGKTTANLLKSNGFKNILTPGRKILDLTNQKKVNDYFKRNKIDIVINCAAKVGGILDNSLKPVDYFLINNKIQNNILEASHKYKVKKVLFLGSSCIYPKKNKIPIKEEYLFSNKLEQTNEAYALAKISGLKLCEYYNKTYKTDFRCLMPTNLYGPYDNFDFNSSHVIPGIISKFHSAKIKNKKFVKLWGTGKPYRDFLHVSDLANAIIKCLKISKNKYNSIISKDYQFINVGSGEEISISHLSQIIKKVIEYKGQIIFDKSKPDGTLRKLIDNSRIKKIGWKKNINLKEGIRDTYLWYKKNISI